MFIEPFQAAVVASIKGALPNVKQCQEHPGKFNLKELQRIAAKAPAVLVALLEVPDGKGACADRVDLPLPMAAYIVTRDTSALSKTKAILNLVEALVLHIKGQTWGLDYVGKPKNIKGVNLYSGAIGKNGVAMWAVTWTQKISIPEYDVSADPDLLKIGLDYQLDPDDGTADATDEINLQSAG